MVDRLITLFESTATTFTSNGIGSLPDAISCQVTEERNGEFELEMDYPIDGARYNDIEFRRIIVARPNPFDDPQPFRIYAISKPLNGRVTVNAAHISYDLSGYTVAPFSAESVAAAIDQMESHMDVSCPFTFTSNKDTNAHMQINVPTSVRAVLGGVEGSLLDTYRGEYEFDKFSVKLWNNRGANNGVTIRYGKNLTSLKQEENCSNVYTHVRPYWFKEIDNEPVLVDLPEKTVAVSGTFNYTKILALDLTDQYENKPTAAQLRNAARSYINEHNIGTPDVSLDVSFVQLGDSEEYADKKLFERVKLCDTVNVIFPKLGVNATAKCIKTIYDVLAKRYDKIELGSAKSNLTTTISTHDKIVKESASKSMVERAVENATKLITGNLGGYVILHDSNGDDQPDEILIMNTADISTATKVWRWNKNGLGYSSTGYNGSYGTAITQDGSIVANFITSGTMSANLIKGGTLKAGGDSNTNGIIDLFDASNTRICRMDRNGFTAYGSDGSYVRINRDVGLAGYNRSGTKIYWASEDEFYMQQCTVKSEITLCDRMRFIPIDNGSYHGIGLLSTL